MKICISRTDRMGDMILTLPVIKSIKLNNPEVKIHVLASKNNAKVLKKINYIDKIIIIDPNNDSILRSIFNIRKTKYKFFINFTPGIRNLFLCLFSNSDIKANLILLSRYKNNYFSKFLDRILTNLFCNIKHIVNRFERLKNNKELHQTKSMFSLVNKCKIKCKQNTEIDINIPRKKLFFSKNKTVVIHLSYKWINSHYSERNLIELISLLYKKKYFVIMTTDFTSKNKFKKIFKNYKIISNSSFNNFQSFKQNPIIFNKLDYGAWLKTIYSVSVVITPECGCTHISAACKIPVNIIYDRNNYPEAIHKEYRPWKGIYKKFIFGEKKLNQKLISKI
tara:strand:+ start:69 stop:1076 length:1008 start_codon:yes stop_codon:yes gene_type:complete